MRKSKNKRVIPGFGLSFGITITMLGLIVIIPLCSLVVFSAKLSFPEFLDTITRPRVLSSYAVSFFTAFVAAAIDAVMGMIIAWVLVRYDFPGKRICRKRERSKRTDRMKRRRIKFSRQNARLYAILRKRATA